MRVVGAVAAAFLSVAMATAPHASAQERCGCTEKDPAAAVELQITAATPVEHSRIGEEQETLVVDLRGQETVLVGDAPVLLEGVDLAEVPVLMAVVEPPATADECNALSPATGVNLKLTGQVYMEETGPVVWTGPCQGTLTIEAAPAADDVTTPEDRWGRGLAISVVALAALALLCLALAPITARRSGRIS
jgi:hypothetical protein